MRTPSTNHALPVGTQGTPSTQRAHVQDSPDHSAPTQITVTVSLPDASTVPASWASALHDLLPQPPDQRQPGDRRDPPSADPPDPAPVPDLVMNTAARTAHVAGRPVRLTRQEFDLLRFLTTHGGKVYTRTQLMQQAWNTYSGGNGRTVDVYVRRLRVRLAGHGPTITTVYGVGYRLDDSERAAVTPSP